MIMKTSLVCLLLITYMGIYYFHSKRLPLKSTKIFTYYYISAVILILFDLITLYTVNHMEKLSVVNSIAHLIYLLAINTTIYLNFLYLRSLLETQLKNSWLIKGLQAAPYIVTSVLMLFIPLGYVKGTYTNYSMGAKVYVLYTSIILYNFLILYYCIRYWKLLNKEKRNAIVASVPIFFGVTVVNITMPEALFSVVYVILTAVGLMLSNENSEKYMDKQTGMFNQYALGIVSSEYISLGRETYAAVITISESEQVHEMIDWRECITTMENIQNFSKKERIGQLYRVGDNGFVLLRNTRQALKKASDAIVEYATGNCNGSISLSYHIIALNECKNSDVMMSRVVEICMDAINTMAVYDFLTGVYNRNSFERELDMIRETQKDVYYLIADVNNLKETNDSMGHSAGDELLQTVAKILKDSVGKDGKVFRQGGDEFAILWQGKDVDTFLKQLEEKRLQVNRERVIPVSFAIGYGKVLDKDGINNADQMMYENKREMKRK